MKQVFKNGPSKICRRQHLKKLTTTARVEKIVLACVVLHNYLQQIDCAKYNPSGKDSIGTIKKGV